MMLLAYAFICTLMQFTDMPEWDAASARNSPVLRLYGNRLAMRRKQKGNVYEFQMSQYSSAKLVDFLEIL